MYLLAIDTSSRIPDLGLAKVSNTDEFSWLYRSGRKHDHRDRMTPNSGALAPELKDAFHCSEISPKEVSLVVVAVGPGSFTGVRQGVVTAKTFAYWNECEVVGVSVIQTLAEIASDFFNQSSTGIESVHVVLDAGRNEVYAVQFKNSSSGFVEGQPEVLMPDKWIGGILPGSALIGPGLKYLSEEQLSRHSVVPKPNRGFDLSVMVRLGLQRHRESGGDDVWAVAPIYSRLSAAEEKLRQSHSN